MIKMFSGLPTNCEFCGSSLSWDDNNVNLICTNPNCSNVSEARIKAFIINISPVDGLGWKTIKKFLDEIGINTVDDLFNTSFRFETDKPNSEKGLFNKMLNQLQSDDYRISISQFMLSLNIEGIGKIGANKMEDNKGLFNRAMKLMIMEENRVDLSDYKSVDTEDLLFMPKYLASVLGDKNAANRFYVENRSYIVSCYNLIKNKLMVTADVNSNSTVVEESNNHVVITGRLSIKRDDYIRMLKNKGWIVDSKVNKDTAYLITNDTNSNTAKAKDAIKFGTEIITESEFNNRFNIC